jgi:hypothetical protein
MQRDKPLEEIDGKVRQTIHSLHAWLTISRNISQPIPSIIAVFEKVQQVQEYRYKFETLAENQRRDERKTADQEIYATATTEIKEELDMRQRNADRARKLFPKVIPMKYGPQKGLYRTIQVGLSENAKTIAIEYPLEIKKHFRAVRNRRLLRVLLRNAVLFISCIIIFMVGADIAITHTTEELSNWLDQRSKADIIKLSLIVGVGVGIEFYLRRIIDHLMGKLKVNHLRKDLRESMDSSVKARMLGALVESNYWHTLARLLPPDKHYRFFRTAGEGLR